jgi:CxxC-x17-CxxC domain-containing protein
VSFTDKSLVCRDCGAEFVFTAGEQEFYAEKGFANEPSRCRDCRTAQKRNRGGMGQNRSRQLYDVVCAQCGAVTQVPFQPRGDRPVYCRDCFQAAKK